MSAALALRVGQGAAEEAPAADLPMAPGLYPDWPAQTYFAHPAVNCSTLKLVETCPAKIGHDSDETPAMVRGTLTHAALLEPHILESAFFVSDVTQNEKHRAYQEVLEKAAGRKIVKSSAYQMALRMRDAVHANRDARDILAPGLMVEQSALWRDRKTGLLCKGKADAIRPEPGWRAIVDVKTTTDASPRRFPTHAWKLKYQMQAAFYTWGYSEPEVLGWEVEHFVFLAVESTPPFIVQPYIVSNALLARGQQQVRAALDRYAELRAANYWPGYSEVMETLDLPAWAE